MRMLDLRDEADREWLRGLGSALVQMAEQMLVEGARGDGHLRTQVEGLLCGEDWRVAIKLGGEGEVAGLAALRGMGWRRGVRQYSMQVVMVREEERGRGIGGTLVSSLVGLLRVETEGVFGLQADLPGCMRAGGAGLYRRLGWEDRGGEGWQLEEEDWGWGLLTRLGKRVAAVLMQPEEETGEGGKRIRVWNEVAMDARERVASGRGLEEGEGCEEEKGRRAVRRLKRVWEGGLEDWGTGRKKQRLILGADLEVKKENWERWLQEASRRRALTREERAVGTSEQEPD